MTQVVRVTFTTQELKCLLYAISKIKPYDNISQEYVFDINSFYTFFPGEKDPHTAFLSTLLTLDQKNWWHKSMLGTEQIVRFFHEIRVNNFSNTVSFRFNEALMASYLLQASEFGPEHLITALYSYSQMKHLYSPKLSSLLMFWYREYGLGHYTFDIDQLKEFLWCEKYENYSDFNKRVLTPAVKEINQYLYFQVDYTAETRGKKVTHLTFRTTAKDRFWASRPFDICNEVCALLK